MPKQIDYPRATLKNCYQLAKAVDDLGGDCSLELAADKLNKKVGGAFQALVGSAVKYGLIASKGGKLSNTKLFRDHKLAYSSDEADKVLVKAFLNPPLFMQVFSRFEGKRLPVAHFEKLLIREFEVPENISSRVSKYFLEGAKQCGLMDSKNILSTDEREEEDLDELNHQIDDGVEATEPESGMATRAATGYSNYSVRITGPNIDSVMVIEGAEDLEIVHAMLKKISNRLEQELATEVPKN